MVLRCIQSSGSSGTVALAQAVLDDLTTSEQRGKFLAYLSIGFIMGPALGPVGRNPLRYYTINRLTFVLPLGDRRLAFAVFGLASNFLVPPDSRGHFHGHHINILW